LQQASLGFDNRPRYTPADPLSPQVQIILQRVAESRAHWASYEERIVPAAERSVDSARTDYIAGRGDFMRLFSTQQQLIEVREQQLEAFARYHARLAEFERAIGGPIPTTPSAESIPPSRSIRSRAIYSCSATGAAIA
jgi:hypothetical protein